MIVFSLLRFLGLCGFAVCVDDHVGSLMEAKPICNRTEAKF